MENDYPSLIKEDLIPKPVKSRIYFVPSPSSETSIQPQNTQPNLQPEPEKEKENIIEANDLGKKLNPKERDLKNWEKELKRQAANLTETSSQLIAARVTRERLEYEIKQMKVKEFYTSLYFNPPTHLSRTSKITKHRI